MCCCGKPSINGAIGAYSWDGKTHSTRQPMPPILNDGDELLYDEAGRCGGIDAHSHHFQLVKSRHGDIKLLVCHGGGEERIDLGCTARLALPCFVSLDTNARFWLLHSLYSTHRDGAAGGAAREDLHWRRAAAEKRIRTRKMPRRGAVKVWIEPPPIAMRVAEAA